MILHLYHNSKTVHSEDLLYFSEKVIYITQIYKALFFSSFNNIH